jgi:hypothetical protein
MSDTRNFFNLSDSTVGAACGCCRFWEQTERSPGINMGECRRYAPRQAVKEDTESAYTVWPLTDSADWCGEFKEGLSQ